MVALLGVGAPPSGGILDGIQAGNSVCFYCFRPGTVHRVQLIWLSMVSISQLVADLHSKIFGPPPAQILSISCSFWENVAKSYVSIPLECWRHLGKFLDPPLSISSRILNLNLSVILITVLC